MSYTGKIAGFFGEYRWLSNFWMVPIVIGPYTFPSAEHAYQAAKSEYPDDWKRFQFIETPGYAKKAGRLLRMREGWDDLKVDAMAEILEAKFTHPDLRQKLLDTQNHELIEENNWGDSWWGVDNKRGRGVNALGYLLMRQRALLRGQHDLAAEHRKEIDRLGKIWLEIPF